MKICFQTRWLGLLVLLVLLGCGIAAAPLAQADPYGNGNADMFNGALAPYGQWVDHPTYGRVWYPTQVPQNWRPYTNGHWAHTVDYGWLWVSDYSWGWAPFHYGRWLWDDWYGWVWVPGRIWAPAWVFWRYGGGYTAWAPMPPTVVWEPGVGVVTQYFDSDRDLGRDGWVAVRDRDLTQPYLLRNVIDPWRNSDVLRRTNRINQITVIRNNIYNPGVPVRDLERVTGRRIEPVRVREWDDPASRPHHPSNRHELEIVRPRFGGPGADDFGQERARAEAISRHNQSRPRSEFNQPGQGLDHRNERQQPRVPRRFLSNARPDESADGAPRFVPGQSRAAAPGRPVGNRPQAAGQNNSFESGPRQSLGGMENQAESSNRQRRQAQESQRQREQQPESVPQQQDPVRLQERQRGQQVEHQQPLQEQAWQRQQESVRQQEHLLRQQGEFQRPQGFAAEQRQQQLRNQQQMRDQQEADRRAEMQWQRQADQQRRQGGRDQQQPVERQRQEVLRQQQMQLRQQQDVQRQQAEQMQRQAEQQRRQAERDQQQQVERQRQEISRQQHDLQRQQAEQMQRQAEQQRRQAERDQQQQAERQRQEISRQQQMQVRQQQEVQRKQAEQMQRQAEQQRQEALSQQQQQREVAQQSRQQQNGSPSGHPGHRNWDR